MAESTLLEGSGNEGIADAKDACYAHTDCVGHVACGMHDNAAASETSRAGWCLICAVSATVVTSVMYGFLVVAVQLLVTNHPEACATADGPCSTGPFPSLKVG